MLGNLLSDRLATGDYPRIFSFLLEQLEFHRQNIITFDRQIILLLVWNLKNVLVFHSCIPPQLFQ